MRSVDGMVVHLGEIMRNPLETPSLPQITFGPDGRPRALVRIEEGETGRRRNASRWRSAGREFSVGQVQAKDDAILVTFSLLSQLFSQYRENADLS